ncbi:DUF86 domain-containing protein [bacterium]|nr:DUF86 domain-containing protein [bacterium]
MSDSAIEAISFIKDKTRQSLETDRKLVLSLVKSIEIIGEAASKVTNDFRLKYTQIPWQNIITMRNRLIHAYFDIDLDILWNTVIEDLPPLILELDAILQCINQFDSDKQD